MTVTTIVDPEPIELPDRGHGPVTLSVHRQGDGPAVVFSHGFPELGYSWRYQLPAVAAAGFQGIAPDQRGYGGSSRPDDIAAYALTELCADLDAMCGALGVDRAVFVGHDWGGAVAWAMPLLHPDRVAGVVGICTPYLQFPTTEFLSMLVEGDIERQYMLWFQEPGVAEAYLDPRVRPFFEQMMVGGISPEEVAARAFRDGKLDMNPFRDLDSGSSIGHPAVSPAEVDHYVEVFERTGFRGGMNWYRNLDHNAERDLGIGRVDPGVPCLMITAEWDPALSPALAEPMRSVISDLEVQLVPRAGHWVQQERPDDVNAILVDWLTRRFG